MTDAKKRKKEALIIGRFQPFHLGHIDLIEKTKSKGFSRIIIGIGNNGDFRTKKYPFKFEEVKEMIGLVFNSNLIEVRKIPDIKHDEDYAKHVEKITGSSQNHTCLISGNPHTIGCFTIYSKNYKILTPGVDFTSKYKNLSATKVREIINKGKKWEKYLDPNVSNFLKKINAEKIIHDLMKK
ncbi:MAG: adenylyltransferase/cytidyltransferase family protein [Nanobdellota archaeon]